MINKIKKIKNYLYWSLKGQYNPEKLWNEWGKTFIDDPIQKDLYPQHKWMVKILNKEKPKTLLEVGCGFGRNIRFILQNYKKPLAITGVDISSSMLANAKKYLKDYLQQESAKVKLKKVWRSQISLRETNILNLPFSNHSFDIVLCHGVLMHVKPKDIKKAISELLRVSKGKLIVVEQSDFIKHLNTKPYQKINYYTYTYPYKALFKSSGGKIDEVHKHKQLDWFLIKANA